jgi:hypothetical protein
MDVPHMVSLEAKHAQLDQLIRQEVLRPSPDQGLLSRLKKQKLKIKEEMSHV